MNVAASLTFGRRGNSLASQVEGFAAPEDDFTWSIGASSTLQITAVTSGGDAMLELALNPFVVPGKLDQQRLVVEVNGARVADETLRGEGTVAWRVPARVARPDGRMVILLRHEDAESPAALGAHPTDTRALGFSLRTLRVLCVEPARPADLTVLPPHAWSADRERMSREVQAATGLTPRDLALCFQSLGHNCEFGMVQRHLEAEPEGMLRWAAVTLDALLAGLRCGFEGAGESVTVGVGPGANGTQEYLVRDIRHDIGLHTMRLTSEAPPEQVRAEHGLRLRYLHRFFLEGLRSGERIYVFQRVGQMTVSQARPLLALLRSYGPNSLLYVDETPGMPSGAVAQREEGLFHGRLDRLAPAGALDALDLPGWLRLCANPPRLSMAGRR